MEQDAIRINRYLSQAGLCSRRKADAWVEQGRIQVNGEPAEAGIKVYPGDVVTVDGRAIQPQEQKVVLAFHKPRGLVCSMNGQGAETVQEYLNYPIQLYYVGRLDKDSEGLLLMTNDGELVNAVSRARNHHEKEYEVWVERPITKEFLQKMRNGIPILDTITRKCQVTQTGNRSFRIILTQGLNRQIRRMCEYCGYHVKRLRRIRVMNIELGELATGEYRKLEKQELEKLYQLLQENG